jgi:pimeloyl-ACP methyl ester carboxylesterase
MLGRHDWQVPSIVAVRYFERIRAPHKVLVWFESSAHNPPFEEPERFNRAVVDTVRDLTSLERVETNVRKEGCC